MFIGINDMLFSGNLPGMFSFWLCRRNWWNWFFFHSRHSFSAGYFSAPFLLQCNEFELYWGAVFSVHTFSWFLKWNWTSDFGHAETGSGVKFFAAWNGFEKWHCGVKFLRSNFKLEWENGVWTKFRFLASGFFVHFDVYCISIFWIGFFINGFPSPF